MLTEATRIDPKFADAWARLGEACALMQLSFEPGARWQNAAQHAVRRALALAPANAIAYAARGRLMFNPLAGFKLRAALKATTTALTIDPGCQSAWMWSGLIFQHLGFRDPARRHFMRVLASDPDNVGALTFLGQTYFVDGDYDGALEFTERALRLDRQGLYANLFLPAALLYQGRGADMLSAVKQAREHIGDDPVLRAYESLLHARDGRAARARTGVRKALAGKSYVHAHHTAHIAGGAYALLGDRARSVALLRKAASSGYPCYTGFRDDPHLENLRQYAPFLRLLSAIKRECVRLERDFVDVPAADQPDRLHQD
jgi:tetratricopeptide (TPR) repeat protein